MALFPIVLGAAALYGAAKLLSGEKPRFVGDRAEKGDIVEVHPAFLTGVPSNMTNALFVQVRIDGLTKDALQGPIVGFQGAPHTPDSTQAIGSFVVKRSDVYKVIRNGKTIAQNG